MHYDLEIVCSERNRDMYCTCIVHICDACLLFSLPVSDYSLMLGLCWLDRTPNGQTAGKTTHTKAPAL